MKKLLLVGAMVTVATLSYAQTIIPKAGITLSNVAASDDVSDGLDSKSKLGFTLGIGLNIPVSESFSIQPELNFTQKGYKFKEEDTDTYTFDGETATAQESFEQKYTINYLELPVLARVSFGDVTKFFLNAGPSIGLGLGGKTKYEYSYRASLNGEVLESDSGEGDAKIKFGDEPDNNDESNDQYYDNRMDFGLQLGGGALISNKIMIEVRYGLGLSNLFDKVEDFDTKSQNRVLQFTIGIPLSLGK